MSLPAAGALRGTVGLRDLEVFQAPLVAATGVPRFADYWGTSILAGLAMVILLGLVYPWGNAMFLRRLLRILAWAGSRVAVAGATGLVLIIQYFTGDTGSDRLGGIHPAVFLFVYVCFVVLGVAFGVTAWLTRR